MSTFFYWIPSERPFTSSATVLQVMREHGLGYAIEDRLTFCGCHSGPDGVSGATVCAGGNEYGRLGYWPQRQTWKRIPGSPAWCGVEADGKPRPEELARTEQVNGEWLLLDDGHRWLAPMARRFVVGDPPAYAVALPQRLTMGDDGLWTLGGVKRRYERLWQLACEYGEAWARSLSQAEADEGCVKFELDDQQLLETAVAALQTNYRLGAVELDLLGIFDQQACMRILSVLIDEGTYAAWIKKKLRERESAGGNS